MYYNCITFTPVMPRGFIHTTETLFKKIKKSSDGCWNFTGPICKRMGYGKVGYKGTVTNAHRLSWILVNGPILNGLLVCHKCDNRKCINPDHLFLGTYKDNTQDMISKGRRVARQKSNRCKRGHDTSMENSRRPSGTCILCAKITARARYLRNRKSKQL